jgi:hypothetical protein
MVDAVSTVNAKLVGSLTSVNFLNVLGWIVFAILIIGGGFWAYMAWRNKRLFNIRITAWRDINHYFEPKVRDFAKTVKIGKAGYEIIYLKKLKTHKISFGGYNDLMFFIMPDGIWYNGKLPANLNTIDVNGGLIPVITTNPLMRAQYSALEKQIDSLTQSKVGFWEKYGSWVLSVGFVLVAGIMLWLNYKEYNSASGNFKALLDGLNVLIDKLNILTSNAQTAGVNTGLIPV